MRLQHRSLDGCSRTPLPAWAVPTVLLLAAALRVYGLTKWSLWEDEETTIYFSLNPSKPFPAAFPIFFRLLGGLYAVTGPEVLSGRLLAAAIGMVTLVQLWRLTHAFVGERAALIALTLASISPGHIFWSQSIRYYGLALAFQLAAVQFFLAGWISGRLWLIAVSNVAVVLALNCHFSGILLLPVFIAWIGYVGWSSGLHAGFWRRVLAFAIPALLVVLVWARALRAMQGMLGGWTVPSARDPVHVVITGLVYFGPPAFLLAACSIPQLPRGGPTFVFFTLLAALPLAELATIATLNLVNVTWYYGFIALAGVATLAGVGWEVGHERGRAFTWFALLASLAFYAPVLAAYYVTGHGDRPRWEDAADFIRENGASPPGMQIYAQVPGAVAFYLGVDPAMTMGNDRVRSWREGIEAVSAGKPAWLVTESRLITTGAARLLASCNLAATFDSHLLLRDRSVAVYRCAGSPAEVADSQPKTHH